MPRRRPRRLAVVPAPCAREAGATAPPRPRRAAARVTPRRRHPPTAHGQAGHSREAGATDPPRLLPAHPATPSSGARPAAPRPRSTCPPPSAPPRPTAAAAVAGLSDASPCHDWLPRPEKVLGPLRRVEPVVVPAAVVVPLPTGRKESLVSSGTPS
ncbi:vegetative cell wall protein gp1-like [Panicum virgatum]|uniref:vegetative cell wall protein gp1-like n=1 Tax=Panicum virgatum TaxID=38727 RepID=UPI0019D6088C|nr:vegetative cell wall protein gp1-like [Panicum virgatum]